MNKKHVSIAVVVLILGAAAFKVTIASENKPETVATEDVKSVGYFVANAKEALAKNKQCFDQGLDMQATPNCANALHALEISHVGGDRVTGYKYAKN